MIYRVLVPHGLINTASRGRRREDYRRSQRAVPMELWQVDIVDASSWPTPEEIK